MICRSDEDRVNPRAPFNESDLNDDDRDFEVVVFGEDEYFAFGVKQLDHLVGEFLRPRNIWSYSELDLNHDRFAHICDQDGEIVGTIKEVTP